MTRYRIALSTESAKLSANEAHVRVRVHTHTHTHTHLSEINDTKRPNESLIGIRHREEDSRLRGVGEGGSRQGETGCFSRGRETDGGPIGALSQHLARHFSRTRIELEQSRQNGGRKAIAEFHVVANTYVASETRKVRARDQRLGR